MQYILKLPVAGTLSGDFIDTPLGHSDIDLSQELEEGDWLLVVENGMVYVQITVYA